MTRKEMIERAKCLAERERLIRKQERLAVITPSR